MTFDYMVVGSGFFGAICAKYLHDRGESVIVVEKRNHIGGNCHTEQKDGINVHTYGPHVFHTNNQKVWSWINQYATFRPFRLQTMATAEENVYSLPFSMFTFEKIYNVRTPQEAIECIANDCEGIGEAENLETSAIRKVGRKVYELLIKGYTEKQWMRDANTLPSSIVKRLPVRFTYDNNYFNDTFQGTPIGGYTQIFEKLLDGIPVMLETDFFTSPLPKYKKLIYTGPIDKFFDYIHGALEYKTVIHKQQYYPVNNVQGCPVMNYCDKSTPYTRTIEHKHFEDAQTEGSWVSTEFPTPYIVEQTDPYYPVNDGRNNAIYEAYKAMADRLPNVYFGGRLAEYKYYDMHQVIESALKFCEKTLGDLPPRPAHNQ